MGLKNLFSSFLVWLFFCVFASFSFADDAAPGGPVAYFPEPQYTFDQALEGTEVLHDFVIMNKGDAVLDVQKVKSG